MGRKRSRSSSRSRSRSRSRQRHHSSSSDSGSHRHSRSSGRRSRKRGRVQSRSRSRDRRRSSSSRSRSRSRSRERRRSRRSRSRSRERRHRRSRSRSSSRDRERERRRRARSRSAERSRAKRRRSRSHSSSWTRGRRRRQRSRSSSYDSRGSSRRRKPSSHDQSPSRGGALSTEDRSNQSSMGNLSSEIPGFSNMTPAERVKAKMKLMLEKTTDKMSKETSSEEQTTAVFAPPSAADIARIEGESFEPASFISHRTAKKEVRSGVGGAKKHFDVTSVDPSEYEPQVVELSDQLIQDASLDEDNEEQQKQNEREIDHTVPKDGGASRKDSSSAVVNKNARWLSKLQKLRQQFSTPPTD